LQTIVVAMVTEL